MLRRLWSNASPYGWEAIHCRHCGNKGIAGQRAMSGYDISEIGMSEYIHAIVANLHTLNTETEEIYSTYIFIYMRQECNISEAFIRFRLSQLITWCTSLFGACFSLTVSIVLWTLKNKCLTLIKIISLLKWSYSLTHLAKATISAWTGKWTLLLTFLARCIGYLRFQNDAELLNEFCMTLRMLILPCVK